MKRHRCIRLVLQGRHVRPRLVLESIVQKSRSCCNAGEKFQAEMIRSGMIRSILDDSIWTFFYKITDLFHSHIKTSTARFFENINCKTSPLEWWFNVTISVWCKGDSRNFFGSKRRELRIELKSENWERSPKQGRRKIELEKPFILVPIWNKWQHAWFETTSSCHESMPKSEFFNNIFF